MKIKNVILAGLLLVAAVGCNKSETENGATTNAPAAPATTNAAVTNK